MAASIIWAVAVDQARTDRLGVGGARATADYHTALADPTLMPLNVATTSRSWLTNRGVTFMIDANFLHNLFMFAW